MLTPAIAVAQGVVNQVRLLGGSISLSVATIVFNNRARQDLSTVLTPDELTQLQKAPTFAYSLSLAKQLAVRDVFATSFNDQLRVCTDVAAATFVISLFAYAWHPPDVIQRKTQHEAILAGAAEED